MLSLISFIAILTLVDQGFAGSQNLECEWSSIVITVASHLNVVRLARF
jgi:hypothetical protein